MKHGDTVLLKRGKNRYACTVVSDHSPLFPAVTILRGGDEWIVGINELLNPEDIKAEAEAKRRQDEESVADVVSAYREGHATIMAIANGLGKQMVQVLSRCRKAERMGLIKLERKKNAKNPVEKVSDMSGGLV